MAFVKLDEGILNSTLWFDRDLREVFITALLMAGAPREFREPLKQLELVGSKYTGFEAPEGWYGFVAAAGIGILKLAGVEREPGMEALRRLGEPESESRSPDFDGRRMIRVAGGFIILNYMKYRDKDYTAAERQRRLRERKRAQEARQQSNEPITRDVQDDTRDIQDRRGGVASPSRNITQTEDRGQMIEAKDKSFRPLLREMKFWGDAPFTIPLLASQQKVPVDDAVPVAVEFLKELLSPESPDMLTQVARVIHAMLADGKATAEQAKQHLLRKRRDHLDTAKKPKPLRFWLEDIDQELHKKLSAIERLMQAQARSDAERAKGKP